MRRIDQLRTVAGLLCLGVAGTFDGIGYALLPSSYMRRIDS